MHKHLSRDRCVLYASWLFDMFFIETNHLREECHMKFTSDFFYKPILVNRLRKVPCCVWDFYLQCFLVKTLDYIKPICVNLCPSFIFWRLCFVFTSNSLWEEFILSKSQRDLLISPCLPILAVVRRISTMIFRSSHKNQLRTALIRRTPAEDASSFWILNVPIFRRLFDVRTSTEFLRIGHPSSPTIL